MINFFKRNYALLIVVILCFWAVKPLFSAGFYTVHDDVQVQRVFEMFKSLKSGTFPVRWVSDLGFGYGYPLFNFYDPFAYYVGAAVMFFGFNALFATKFMIITAVIFSGVSMYLLAQKLWGKFGGIISAVLYVYLPYHAVDVYVRGDIAETYAYAFIPLVFLGVYQIFSYLNVEKQDQKKLYQALALTAFSFAGVIISHNLTALMIAPFLTGICILICIISYIRTKRFSSIYFLGASLLLGLLISAFYSIPALSEMRFTNVLSQLTGGANYKQNFVCISQLWNSPWGFGGSIPGCIDGLSFRIGKAHLLLASAALILALGALTVIKKSVGWQLRYKSFIVLILFVGFLISAFMTLSYSQIIWNFFHPMAFLQYPWRFLVLVGFFLSLSAGFICFFVQSLKLKSSNFLVLAMAIVAILLNFYVNAKLFIPQQIFPLVSGNYTNNFNLEWTASNISHEYMPIGFNKPKTADFLPKSKVVLQKGQASLRKINFTAGQVTALLSVQKPSVFLINIAFFPTWQIFLDNHKVGFVFKNHLFLVSVVPGVHLLRADFIQTPIEKLSDVLSVFGIIIAILGIILPKAKKSYAK